MSKRELGGNLGGKNNNKEDEIIREKNSLISCCVPLIKCTKRGDPLPKTIAEGIKFSCTNSVCQYTKHLVHPECFRSLETSLMELLTYQDKRVLLNQEMLWEPKGLALIQKNLKCECGKGYMKRDDKTWAEREKLLNSDSSEKKKTLSTVTSKPQANFNSKIQKNVEIQTDESSFPQTFFNDYQRFPNGLSHDSVIYSINPNLSTHFGPDSLHRFPKLVVLHSDQASLFTSSMNKYSTSVTFLFKSDETAAVEIIQNGKKQRLKDLYGDEWIPLYLSMAHETPEVGATANIHYAKSPESVIYDILKIMGKSMNEVQINPKWKFNIFDNYGTKYFEIETSNGVRLFPEDTVVAAFLKPIKARAEYYLKCKINEINISSNFELTESQKNVFNNAALKIGLNVASFYVSNIR